jgi:hypothetical protein
MILHGIYKDGQITLKEKKPPLITAEVEIILKEKPWQRKHKKIKVKGELLSETIIKSRYE